MRLFVLLAAAVAALATLTAEEPARASGDAPVTVLFRDLFDARGKPSERAFELIGREVRMIGFPADPPSDESPFVVVVGEPTTDCPYCAVIFDDEHLPYVLAYTEQYPQMGYNTRIVVVGTLEADHDFDPTFGIHNDLRLLNASVTRDVRPTNPVRARLRAQAIERDPALAGALEGTPVTAENVDEENVDE